MKCSCPKCHAHIELDLPEVTEEGTSAQCPECNCRFTVSRESFGGRALRKSNEITCASCGHQLGPYLSCHGCGVLYPDYLVATLGRKKKRAVQKVKLDVSVFPERKVKAAPTVPRIDAAPQLPQGKQAKKGAAEKTGLPLLVISLVVLLLAVGAGTFLYKRHQSAEQFSNNIVLMVYFTKIGESKSIDACNRVAADWKTTGQGVPPRPAPKDLRELGNIKVKVDGTAEKLKREDAPKELLPSLDKLDRLKAAYEAAHKLATSPTGTVASYTTASAAADDAYKAASRDFRSGLPPKLVQKIKSASRRYRGLQGFLEM